MHVLVTNGAVRGRTGSEMYVHDLVLALRRRSHEVTVFAPDLGALGDDLRHRGVAVHDDLAAIDARPDVLHLQATAEAVAAVLRFPRVPAVRVYHSPVHWADEPLALDRLQGHVAVDHAVLARLVAAGIPAERVDVVPNGVDLERFTARPPLPPAPRRALVFSNYVAGPELDAIRRGCRAAGVTCDALGLRFDNVTEAPESVLGGYDVVFAKGRSAREAIAVGCAVVTCDAMGVGGMVTAASYDRFQELNFGLRTLTGPVSAEGVVAALAGYDPDDAAAVSARLRAEHGLEGMVDAMEAVYERVVAAGPAPPFTDADLAAIGAFVQRAGADRFALGALTGRNAQLQYLADEPTWRRLARQLRHRRAR